MNHLFTVKSALLFCLLAGTSVWSATTITLNQQQLTYEDTPPRLAEIIAPIAFDAQWYWSASRLYRLNPTAETLSQQQQALVLLARLKDAANAEEQWIFEALAKDIATWPLAERIAIDIDYDRARANSAANPRFEPGQYQLTLEPRPDMFGLLVRLILKPRWRTKPLLQSVNMA